MPNPVAQSRFERTFEVLASAIRHGVVTSEICGPIKDTGVGLLVGLNVSEGAGASETLGLKMQAYDPSSDGWYDYHDFGTMKTSTGTAHSVTMATTTPGDGTHDEVQTAVIAHAVAGTFTLTFGGQTTTNLAYNASAADVQAALEALSSIGAGNVGVTFDTDTWTITFGGDLGLANQAQITSTATGLQSDGTGGQFAALIGPGFTAGDLAAAVVASAHLPIPPIFRFVLTPSVTTAGHNWTYSLSCSIC